MTLSAMTFHESYGDLASSTLRLIKRYNVSPADYDMLLSQFGLTWKDTENIPWDILNDFITSHSRSGIYVAPTFY